MTRALLAVVLCSSLAFADAPPSDAPVRDVPGTSVHVEAGESVSFAARCLSDAEHMKSEAQCTADHEAAVQVNAKCDGKDCVFLPRRTLVALIVGGIVLALASGAAGYAAAKVKR